MSTRPQRIRKKYTNQEYPLVIMRFEDGHEIKVYKGTGKQFDAYPGETVKLLAMFVRKSAEARLPGLKPLDPADGWLISRWQLRQPRSDGSALIPASVIFIGKLGAQPRT